MAELRGADTSAKDNSIDSELEEILGEYVYKITALGYDEYGETTAITEALQAIKALYVSRKEIEEAIDSMYEWSMTDLEKWEYQHKTEKPLISKTELRAKLLPPTKGGN